MAHVRIETIGGLHILGFNSFNTSITCWVPNLRAAPLPLPFQGRMLSGWMDNSRILQTQLDTSQGRTQICPRPCLLLWIPWKTQDPNAQTEWPNEQHLPGMAPADFFCRKWIMCNWSIMKSNGHNMSQLYHPEIRQNRINHTIQIKRQTSMFSSL